MRAGLALRQKWAQEAERARRAADPRLAAQDVAERAAMSTRVRVLKRYGGLITAALRSGDLTVEQALELFTAAEERTYDRLAARRAVIFEGDR